MTSGNSFICTFKSPPPLSSLSHIFRLPEYILFRTSPQFLQSQILRWLRLIRMPFLPVPGRCSKPTATPATPPPPDGWAMPMKSCAGCARSGRRGLLPRQIESRPRPTGRHPPRTHRPRSAGPDRKLMIDANQVWEVDAAIDWVRELSFANPWFIEEPTSPDDVEGHRKIRLGVAPSKSPRARCARTASCSSN